MSPTCGPHVLDQADAKGFPVPVIVEIATHPAKVIPSVGKGGRYFCDRCHEGQVRCRGTVDGFDLWVVLNPCCNRIVTAFYADRPTPLRADQIAQGDTSFEWPHPDYPGLVITITATDDATLWAQVCAGVEAWIARPRPSGAPRGAQVPQSAQERNRAPKHSAAYYKRKKKQAAKKAAAEGSTS